MKKIYLITVALFLIKNSNAQVIFNNSVNTLTLQTYSSGNTITQYTTIPSQFSTIEDGHYNNTGLSNNPNKPFNIASLKTKGWAVVYNPTDNDTFFVSTSWFDTTTKVANRWLVTPQITGIVPNTVLTWNAKSPDPANADAYEVYGTTKTGTLTANDFTIGDRLFTIASYSTASGGENNTWTRRSINLTPFAGQNLRFAFKNYSTNKYQLWIDDIQVVTLPITLDVALSSLKTDKYVLTNSQKTITVNYTNMGANAINALTLNYKIGNSSVQTETVLLPNSVSYSETGSFSFGLPYSISSAGLYPLKCWVSSLNGQTDQLQTNDTLNTNITIQATTPQKRVIVEQFVSANNGESCDAQSKLMALKNDSTVIAINIHDLDSLKASTSTGVINSYKKSFATALINRQYDDSINDITFTRNYYARKIAVQLSAVTPVNVSIINKTYNVTSKQLSFTVKADFVGDVKGDYRISAYLTENNVCGKSNDTTVNGFNQLSNYYTIPWSSFYNTGYFSSTYNAYVLNSWQYKHQNTLIHSFDFSFGVSGTIPTTGVNAGQSYQKTYTLTLPTLTSNISKYIADNIYIVGFVADYNINKYQRSILNSSQTKLTSNPEVIGIKEISTSNFNFKLYPNPSTGIINLNTENISGNYEIKVFDLLGNCVYIQNTYNSLAPKIVDLTGLNNGVYFINISSNAKAVNQKIVIQK